jgi:hypothetical protein
MVWSTPIPQLAPQCHLVPRCRAMMLPCVTNSLPYFLMPRRRPAESRPLLEEPPCFLEAKRTKMDEQAGPKMELEPASGMPASGG